MKTTKTIAKPIAIKPVAGNKEGSGNTNTFRLTIHHINNEGSNTFKTTSSFNEVRTHNEMFTLVNKDLPGVRKAYWNNRIVAENGSMVGSY